MRIIKLVSASLLLVSQMSCALAETKNKNAAQEIKPENKKVDWQLVARQEFEAGNYSEAWCLFTYSGMEDRGQTLIFKVAKKEEAYVKVVGWNSNKIVKTFTLDKKRWNDFKAIVKNDDLADVEGFDGVDYTYVHWLKKGSKVQELRRLKMNTPSTHPEAPAQAKLVAGILELQK
jgi:hypothetical protein